MPPWRPEAEEIPRTAVDLVLTNGKVVTADEAFTIANTVVVNDGRIVEVGAAAIADKYDAGNLVDLQGKTLMPGFIDSHTHIRGRPLRYIELGEVSSISEMQGLINVAAASRAGNEIDRARHPTGGAQLVPGVLIGAHELGRPP